MYEGFVSMSDDFAFTPPSSDLGAPPVRRSENQITPEMVESLRGTRPWALFIAVLAFLGALLMLGAGGMIAVAGAFGGGEDIGGVGVAIGVGVFYAAFGLIYAIPGFRLWSYASAIAEMVRGGRGPAMAKALEAQRLFWKTLGIMFLLSIGMSILMMILMVAVGGVAALSGM